MLSSIKYPIEVCCVVADHSIIDTDVEVVNEYTYNLGLKFKLREYNSWKYTDDRDIITSLPAFHIYLREVYVDTLYPGEKILDGIDDCIQKYEKKRVETKRFLENWNSIFRMFWKRKVT